MHCEGRMEGRSGGFKRKNSEGLSSMPAEDILPSRLLVKVTRNRTQWHGVYFVQKIIRYLKQEAL